VVVLTPTPAPKLPQYFTPHSPAFEALAESSLGDSATPADGWDTAVAGWEAAAAAVDALAGPLNDSLNTLDAAVTDFETLGDDLAAVVATGQALSAAAEASLAASIASMTALPAGPLEWVLSALPALENFTAPVLVDVTSMLESLIAEAVQPFEIWGTQEIDSIFQQIQLLQSELAALQD